MADQEVEEEEKWSSATSHAQSWLIDFRSSCQELFQLVLEETRQVSRSLGSNEPTKLQSLWSRLVALQNQLPGIVEELERHKERQKYLEYLMQVESDLDIRKANLLEKLFRTLERLHILLEESKLVLQSSSLKSTFSEILSLAVRIAGSLSAPTNFEEETSNATQFAPAPTEEMIRESKMARWNS